MQAPPTFHKTRVFDSIMRFGTFDLHQALFTLRPIQGYRYLDRCGEFIVKLEDSLDKGWIPKDLTPQGATLNNHDLSMSIRVDSSSLSMSNDNILDIPTFMDQLCRTYDIFHKTFSIARFNAPSLQSTWQKNVESAEAAEAALAQMGLCSARSGLEQLMGGTQSAMSFVLCTEEDTVWKEYSVFRRVRLESKGLKQIRQPPFDERLIQRARLLPKKQEEALRALLKLREQQPTVLPFAAQLSVELAYESEFSTKQLDFPSFVSDLWKWHESFVARLVRL